MALILLINSVLLTTVVIDVGAAIIARITTTHLNENRYEKG